MSGFLIPVYKKEGGAAGNKGKRPDVRSQIFDLALFLFE